MGIFFMNTADVGDLSRFSASNGSPTVSSTTARTGTNSFRLSSNNWVTCPGPNSTTGYLRICFNTAGGNNGPFRFHINGAAESTGHLTIVCNTNSGQIELRFGSESGTVLDTGGVCFANTWYCLEVYFSIDNTTGNVTIKQDGIEIINYTGDTRNGGATGAIDSIQLYSTVTYTYVDDLIFRDDAWPGKSGILVVVANAAGDTTSWTASTGSDYSCVNEQPPDYTDYLYTDASVTGTVHLFNIASLAVAPETIKAVGVCVNAKLSAAGTGSLRAKLKSGATTANGSDIGLSTSAKWIDAYWTVNPDDSAAFENADINALQVGVETR